MVNRRMSCLLLCLLSLSGLSPSASSQSTDQNPTTGTARTTSSELPDAPQPQAKAREWNPYSGAYVLSWRQTFTAKRFWLPHAIWVGSMVYDAEVTHQGLAHHRCVEASLEDPHPSRGQLYRWDLPEFLGVMGLDVLVRKVGFRWWTYDVGPAVGTVIHVRAGTGWFTQGCYQ